MKRATQGFHWTHLRRLCFKRGDEQGVEVVVEHHVFFVGEVAEEGAWRNLYRLGDLLDGGGGVALLLEETQRVLLDRRPGTCLLALTQAEPPRWRRFGPLCGFLPFALR